MYELLPYPAIRLFFSFFECKSLYPVYDLSDTRARVCGAIINMIMILVLSGVLALYVNNWLLTLDTYD